MTAAGLPGTVPDPAQTPRPIVSVVIPSMNRSGLLRGAIDSVLTQDYPHIQCIVGDGGSGDGSVEVLKSYGSKIEWFSEADRGAFDAINRGWRGSCGSILAWLNEDDRWEPGAVSLAVAYFEQHPDVDVLYGACAGIDTSDRLTEIFPPRPWDFHAAVENCDHIIHQAAAFMRRSILEKVDYLSPYWCHDHDLWLRIALAGGKFEAVPNVLASARIWQGNAGNNPSIVIPAKLGLTERFFATPGLPPELKKLRSRALSNACLRCLSYLNPGSPRNWAAGLKLLTRAILHDPSNLPAVSRRTLIGSVRILLTAKVMAVLAVLLALSIAAASGPSSIEQALRVFYYASVPLLLLIMVYRKQGSAESPRPVSMPGRADEG